jgi:hypothetical protein
LIRMALASQTHRARRLSREQLRALWAFRLTLVTLKPGVHPDDDFEAFVAEFDNDGLVWILEQKGRIRGFHMQRFAVVRHRGRRHLALLPEYGFIDVELRDNPVLPLAAAWVTGLCLLARPGLPVVMAAGVYPPSYIAYQRVVQPMWTWGSVDLEPEDRELLKALGHRVAGNAFDPHTGTVSARTLPGLDREPTSANGKALMAAYEKQNPNWRDGRLLFFLAPLRIRTLAGTVAHAVRRAG